MSWEEQSLEEHDRQRGWVALSDRLSKCKQERSEEASSHARIYAFPAATRRVENVRTYRTDPKPPAA